MLGVHDYQRGLIARSLDVYASALLTDAILPLFRCKFNHFSIVRYFAKIIKFRLDYIPVVARTDLASSYDSMHLTFLPDLQKYRSPFSDTKLTRLLRWICLFLVFESFGGYFPASRGV